MYEAALDLEVIQTENKIVKPITVAAAPATLTPEEQEAVNAVQAR